MNVMLVSFGAKPHPHHKKKSHSARRHDINAVNIKIETKKAIHDLGKKAGGWWVYMLSGKQQAVANADKVANEIHSHVFYHLFKIQAKKVVITANDDLIQDLCRQYGLNTNALQPNTQMTISQRGIWLKSDKFSEYRYYPPEPTAKS